MIHPICAAVRELREDALGETQQQFAHRMQTAIRTIARWERVQPPQGETLLQMALTAKSAKRPELAQRFQEMHRMTCPKCKAPLSEAEIKRLWAQLSASRRTTKSGGRNGGRPKKEAK